MLYQCAGLAVLALVCLSGVISFTELSAGTSWGGAGVNLTMSVPGMSDSQMTAFPFLSSQHLHHKSFL